MMPSVPHPTYAYSQCRPRQSPGREPTCCQLLPQCLHSGRLGPSLSRLDSHRAIRGRLARASRRVEPGTRACRRRRCPAEPAATASSRSSSGCTRCGTAQPERPGQLPRQQVTALPHGRLHLGLPRYVHVPVVGTAGCREKA